MRAREVYAGFAPRALAFAYDYLIISVYLIALIALGVFVNASAPNIARSLFGNPVYAQAIGFFMLTLPVSLYFALFESSSRQATWGKQRRGLKVVDPQGERITISRSFARTLLKFVPWELAHTCVWQISFAPQEPSPLIIAGFILVWLLVGAYAASLLVSRRHQTIYDRLAGTFVIFSPDQDRE